MMQTKIVMEIASDFNADDYILSMAETSGVSVDAVEVLDVSFKVAFSYEFPAGSSITEDQATTAIAQANNVSESAVAVSIAVVRRLSDLRRLAGLQVAAVITTVDANVADAAAASSSDVSVLTSRLEVILGATVATPTVISAPALAVEVRAKLTSSSAAPVAPPSGTEFASSLGARIGKPINVEIELITASPTPVPPAIADADKTNANTNTVTTTIVPKLQSKVKGNTNVLMVCMGSVFGSGLLMTLVALARFYKVQSCVKRCLAANKVVAFDGEVETVENKKMKDWPQVTPDVTNDKPKADWRPSSEGSASPASQQAMHSAVLSMPIYDGRHGPREAARSALSSPSIVEAPCLFASKPTSRSLESEASAAPRTPPADGLRQRQRTPPADAHMDALAKFGFGDAPSNGWKVVSPPSQLAVSVPNNNDLFWLGDEEEF